MIINKSYSNVCRMNTKIYYYPYPGLRHQIYQDCVGLQEPEIRTETVTLELT